MGAEGQPQPPARAQGTGACCERQTPRSAPLWDRRCALVLTTLTLTLTLTLTQAWVRVLTLLQKARPSRAPSPFPPLTEGPQVRAGADDHRAQDQPGAHPEARVGAGAHAAEHLHVQPAGWVGVHVRVCVCARACASACVCVYVCCTLLSISMQSQPGGCAASLAPLHAGAANSILGVPDRERVEFKGL